METACRQWTVRRVANFALDQSRLGGNCAMNESSSRHGSAPASECCGRERARTEDSGYPSSSLAAANPPASVMLRIANLHAKRCPVTVGMPTLLVARREKFRLVSRKTVDTHGFIARGAKAMAVGAK